ncbi:ROK family transcriptional regulator [Streptomyces guryensis]|uniref:ROK family transcriptional regulator n=1 Tax=Streptomyces guryensis TaxID=2886947 RepID=A0A9Q3Z6S0_9ACTN|nr:ROK family transcriptional regulator [Streptomyces guryensis]MCD9877316.1 ROK family transcriptional regulator [Streptomyces guryensis]
MPASPSTARAINDRLALRLLQQEGPLTAGQLKQLTGLSRPSVADLVERLTASGLITVVGEAGEQRRGPNAKLYGIVADRAHLAALDVRTEGVSVVVSDLVGRVLAEASLPIGGDTGTGPAVEQAVALVERVAKEAGADRLHTVGIGAPGLIDPSTGELRDSSGLPEWHRRLVAALQERLPEARVSVENETNLAALAEQRDGAAQDRDTFVLLWLGHGTGAAVVLDGTLRRGASGGTGEIGFLPVPGTAALPSATECEGGFHSLAGSAAIAALAAEHGLTAGRATHEPVAAGVVRGAVGMVSGGGGVAEVPASGGDGSAAALPARSRAGASVRVRGVEAGRGGSAVARQVRTEVRGGGARVGWPASDGPAAVKGRGGEAGVAGPSASASASASASVGGAERGGEGPAGAPDGAAMAGGGDARVAGPASDAGAEGGGAAGDTGRAASAREGVRVPDAASAARFLDALADRLAVGVASVVAVLDPGCLVLGGEVGQAGGDELAARVAERVRRMSPLPTEVRAGTLGGSAVLRGALLTARARAQDELFAPPRR